MFGLGCFWGAERKFWTTPGVVNTRVGFSAGETEAPSYREVCSGMTGHNEVVWLQFDPSVVSYEGLLAVFFEAHDPTQGMRQGNDVGSQYRSGIYVYGETQREAAFVVRAQYGAAVAAAGYGAITTEVVSAGVFYEADEGHQRYLEKNPTGYCGLGGIGVECG
jgi:peptide-methionine (S)-S-oxide reductase